MGQAEGRFYRLIHSKFSPENAPYYVKTNNPYAAGVPDVYYSGMHADLWIEYKFLSKPPVRRVTLNISKLQLDWLRSRTEEGRHCWVIVGIPGGRGRIFRELDYIDKPIDAVSFGAFLQPSIELAKDIAEFTGPRACVHTESETPEAS